MKKRFIQFVLILSLMALTCVAAQATGADEPTSGFRALSVVEAYADDVTLTPVTASNAEVKIDDDERYPGAVKMEVTYKNATAGSEYLLCVLLDDGAATATPSADNMAYINQQTAEGATLKFSDKTAAYPKKPDAKETIVKYAVYLSSNVDPGDGEGGEDAGITGFTKIATFEYYSAGPDVLLGDLNDDEEIDPTDAYLILLLFVAEDEEPTEKQRIAADVNKDGEPDTTDAYLILVYYSEDLESFEAYWD